MRLLKADGESELGRGASAHVQRAELVQAIGSFPAGTPVAFKQARTKGDRFTIEALAREVSLLQRLQHPALLELIASGIDGDKPWLLLPLCDGPTLAQQLQAGGFSEKALRKLGARMTGALAAMHEVGFVHGDVKPENILFDSHGQAFLVDMGFAAPIGSPFSQRGTPGYLPPEYLSGAQWAPSGDIFALGVTMYFAATGEHPVPAALEHGAHSPVILEFSRRDARRPSRRNADISPAMDKWLARALDTDPGQRPTPEASSAFFPRPAPWPMQSEPGQKQINPWSTALRLPFSGREKELGWIAEQWKPCLQGPGPCLLTVRSPLGGGGSRLVSEAARRARRLETYPTLLTGRVTAYDEERPGHVLRSMLRQWLGLPPHAVPRAEDRERLTELLPQGEAEALIIALSPTGAGTPSLAEPKALTLFFARLAARGPLWIQLDDAENAGRASLEPLERLAQEVGQLSVMVVLATGNRPQQKSARALTALRETWQLHGCVKDLELGPLSQADMQDAVRAIFVPQHATRELAQTLLQRTEGSPGRLRELLRTLEAKQQMLPKGERWQLRIPPALIPMPPSQVQALSDRYAALDREDRIWLVRFAIAGGHMDPAVLARAFATTRDEVEYRMTLFVRSGWLERSSAGPRFRRPQVRQALVRAIPEERKRKLHQDLASALEQNLVAPFVLGVGFEEAYHLKSAGDSLNLAKRLPRLIRAMQHSGHPSRMLLLAEWGLEAQTHLSDADPKNHFIFLILGTQAAHELGKRDREQAFLSSLSEMHLDPHADARRLGFVHLAMGRFHAATSSFDRASEFFQSARRSFQRAGAVEREAEATLDFAKLCAASGDIKQASWAVEQAQRLPLKSPERARVHSLLGALALLEDDLEGALRHLGRAKRMLAGDDRRRARARSAEAELLRSRTYRLLGRLRRAWVSLRQAQRLAAFAGERTLEVEVLIRRGRLLTELSRESEAELDLREGLRLAEAIDDRRSRARATTLLGILLAERDTTEGSRLLHKSLSLAQEYKLPRLEALASGLCARLALRRDQLDRAQALSDRALYLLDEVGAELQDRIVVLCSAGLVFKARTQTEPDRLLARADRAWREANERLAAPLLKRRHRRASLALIEAAMTLDGPVYPRTIANDLPGLAPESAE